MTVEAARALVREHAEEGIRCPVCDQFAKVYQRKITAVTASTLIRAYREYAHEAFHLPSFDGVRGGDFSKLAYWRLIVDERRVRPDGGRAGWWKITSYGGLFVKGAIGVPEYAHVYDGTLQQLDGKLITIRDALGTRFDYDELMGRSS
jgi:hypothetical protein